MKKLLIAFSMVGAVALAACAGNSANGTPKTQDLPWFSVTTSVRDGGTLVATGDATCDVVNGKFEIDSDLASPVTFTASNTLTQDQSKVSFDLLAATVPANALPTYDDLTNKHAKVAFAIHQAAADARAFKAWVGGQNWITLTGADVPDEDADYTLLMEFNNTNDAKLVRFTVGENVLKDNADNATEWIPYGTAVTGSVYVDFVGCGKVASFVGKQIYITSEVITIGDKGTVEVKTEDLNAFKKAIAGTSYPTVDAFLAADATAAYSGASFQSGLKVAEAYALGLVVKDANNKMSPLADGNGAITVKADAQANVDGGIPVKMNINPPASSETGATITYTLLGSTTGTAGSYQKVDDFTELNAIAIPTEYVAGPTAAYRFFKVKTNVTLKDAK